MHIKSYCLSLNDTVSTLYSILGKSNMVLMLVGLEFNGPVNSTKVMSSRQFTIHTYPGQA